MTCWAPPYLVLLRAGFCLPPVLPRARCALTAPFHPCCRRLAPPVSGMFSVPLILQVTLTGRYPAHCPAEFGLSSRLRLRLRRGQLLSKPSRSVREARRRTAVWLTATIDCTSSGGMGWIGRMGGINEEPPTRRSPVRSDTARASCTDCCAASRLPPLSWRYSSRSRAAYRPGTCARRSL
jgi:hypothetical protein